jgi:uncharacterized membrane protein YhaH (DUF805 family)
VNRRLAAADKALSATTGFEATMTFTQAIASGFANYIKFTGRAVRSEFWFWLLFTMLGDVAAQILDGGLAAAHITASEPISLLFYLGTLIPSIAVWARRLHDIDRTAWWLLLGLTAIGIVPLIYWACVKGSQGYNRFGPNPLAAKYSQRHRVREAHQ